jgi:hypothetical protein
MHVASLAVEGQATRHMHLRVYAAGSKRIERAPPLGQIVGIPYKSLPEPQMTDNSSQDNAPETQIIAR